MLFSNKMWLAVILSCFIVSCVAFEYPDCVNGPLAGSAICDESVAIGERARDLLAKLNITERLSRLDSDWGPGTIAIPRLGLPMYQWINDALHGLRAGPAIKFVSGPGDFNSSTSFPSPINFAATWNDENAWFEGNTIGVEARAFSNNGRAGLDLWTPNINLFRDPRWGRGQEVPGEDPLAVSRYGAAYVSGMQIGEDPRYWLAAANCKHFAAYDLESWNGTNRHKFDAVVSLRELVEYYLPPFQACVSEGKAASIMCSYNALNGIPTCANDWLLQTLARDTWGLDPNGFITSDCDAVLDIFTAHHYTKTGEEAVALALKAGTDTDCGSAYNTYLLNAYNQSLVNDHDINKSILRLTTTQLRLGYFDNPKTQIYRQYGIEHVNTPTAQYMAQRIAEESFVLLKNLNNNILPINKNNIKTIALIGPLYNDTYYIQGNYRGQPKHGISIDEGLRNIPGITVLSTMGCHSTGSDTSGIEAAVAIAQQADLTIFVGGLDERIEAEGMDRVSISWPGIQQQVIQRLKTAAKTLVILVTGGGQIDLSDEKESSAVAAIMWIGYPSQAAGTAVANVLFGHTSAVSGRLPVTQYPADYINDVSLMDMELRAVNGKPGRTYMFYTGEPVYPFGYGLSYTTWQYSWAEQIEISYNIPTIIQQAKHGISTNNNLLSKAPFITYSINITNTGSVISDHCILLFINSTVSDGPKAKLIDYTRVKYVLPGETRTVYFTPVMTSITQVDIDGNKVILPGNYHVWIGSALEANLDHQFELNGAPAIVEKLPPPPAHHNVPRK